MSELEKDIEKKLTKYAEDKGMLAFKFVSPATRGVVDRLFIMHGHVLFMEIKTRRGKLSPLQIHHGQELRQHNCAYCVSYGYDQGVKAIDDFLHAVYTLDKLCRN